MNLLGYGPVSTETTVLTDTIPDQMSPPVNTSVSYNSMVLTWPALTSDASTGRDPIIYYRLDNFDRYCFSNNLLTCTVNFDASDGVWVEVTSFSVNPTALSKTVVKSPKYNEDTLYDFRVSA
jgi:hypothetical protein